MIKANPTISLSGDHLARHFGNLAMTAWLLALAIMSVGLSSCSKKDLNMKWGNFSSTEGRSQEAGAGSFALKTDPNGLKICVQNDGSPSETCGLWTTADLQSVLIPVSISDVMTPKIRMFPDDDSSPNTGAISEDLGPETVTELSFPYELLILPSDSTPDRDDLKSLQWSKVKNLMDDSKCKLDQTFTLSHGYIKDGRLTITVSLDLTVSGAVREHCIAALTQAMNCMNNLKDCGKDSFSKNELVHLDTLQLLSPWHAAKLIESSDLPKISRLSVSVNYQ